MRNNNDLIKKYCIDNGYSVGMIDGCDINKLRSPWGNSYHYITEEDLEELKSDKVIFIDDGEYCTFIALKKGER